MTILARRATRVLVWLLVWPALAQVRHLTILHANDLHAKFLSNHEGRGGFAYLASAIKQEKQDCRACLTLHAGDFITGSPVSTIYEGLPVFEIANAMRFDASTIGNHEFDHGWEAVSRYGAAARFPLLLSNVSNSSGQLLARKGSQIFKVGGLHVGVIGGLTMAMPDLSTPANVGPFHIDSLVDRLRAEIGALRGQTDLIVLLLHITADEEDRLLAQLPEAPVIIAGHVHRGMDQPKVVDGRVLVRVLAYGFELGRLDLDVNVETKKVESFRWKRIQVNRSDFKPDAKVARLVDYWERKVSGSVDVTIGESRRVYTRPELRKLFSQALKEETHSDFAFINEGAMRDELPKGRVTIRDVYNIMPFNNRVLVGRFQGAILPAVVREGYAIEPEKPYRFAIQDFTSFHQKAQLGVSEDLEFPEQGPLVRDLLIDWIRRKKILE
jgi:5'-nucleotidase / UDP-sugar diphosphatase